MVIAAREDGAGVPAVISALPPFWHAASSTDLRRGE
jgi:hypothetical protein